MSKTSPSTNKRKSGSTEKETLTRLSEWSGSVLESSIPQQKKRKSTSEVAIQSIQMIHHAKELKEKQQPEEKKTYKLPSRSKVATQSKTSPLNTKKTKTISCIEGESPKSESAKLSESIVHSLLQQQATNKEELEDKNHDDMLDKLVEMVDNAETFEFTDTHTAMLKIRQEIANSILNCRHKMKFFFPPIILKHVIYNESIVKEQNRTQIDIIINEMIEKNEVRQFFIDRTMYRDIFGYVFTKDLKENLWDIYRKHLANLENSAKDKCDEENERTVLPYFKNKKLDDSKKMLSEPEKKRMHKTVNDFLEKVLKQRKEPFIEKTQLSELLFLSSEAVPRHVQEQQITLLVTLGTLTIRDESSFYFSIPNLAQYMTYLMDGRKEILSTLRRKQFKEIMLNTLLQIPLRNSIFSPMFHIRDMVGDGEIILLDINGQQMVRLR